MTPSAPTVPSPYLGTAREVALPFFAVFLADRITSARRLVPCSVLGPVGWADPSRPTAPNPGLVGLEGSAHPTCSCAAGAPSAHSPSARAARRRRRPR